VYEKLQHQEFELTDFIHKNAKVFCDKWDGYIEMKLNSGIPNVEEVFDLLVLKENITEEERLVLVDYRELEKLVQDHIKLVEVNKVRVFEEQRKLKIPEFVKNNETLLKAWIDKWE
jgi:hypothetical protein